MAHDITGLSRSLRWLLPAAVALSPGPLIAGSASGASSDPALERSGLISIYVNSPFGEGLEGSREALLAAVHSGAPLGVAWQSWHAEHTGRCTQVTEAPDGRIQCAVEVWCDDAAGQVPAGHGHRTNVDTNGNTTSMILVLRKATGEQSIIAAEERPSSISWFRLDSPARSVPSVDTVAAVQ